MFGIKAVGWNQIDNIFISLSTKTSLFIIVSIPIFATAVVFINLNMGTNVRVPANAAIAYFGQISLALGYIVHKIGYPSELGHSKGYLECLYIRFSEKHNKVFRIIERSFKHEKILKAHIESRIDEAEEQEESMRKEAVRLLVDTFSPRLNSSIISALDAEINLFTEEKFNSLNSSRSVLRWICIGSILLFGLANIIVVYNSILIVFKAL